MELTKHEDVLLVPFLPADTMALVHAMTVCSNSSTNSLWELNLGDKKIVETMWSLLHFQWPPCKFPVKRNHKSSFTIKSQGFDILFYITMRDSSHAEKGR